jgi:hypothetical protein
MSDRSFNEPATNKKENPMRIRIPADFQDWASQYIGTAQSNTSPVSRPRKRAAVEDNEPVGLYAACWIGRDRAIPALGLDGVCAVNPASSAIFRMKGEWRW